MIKNHEIYYPLYTDRDHFIILVTGGRGCEAPDTEVMMADLTVKKIKDIRIGEYVMGDDFSPRLVLNTCRGRSQMYRVHQTNAEDYFVNEEHILTLRKSSADKRRSRLYPDYPDVIDISIKDYLKQSKTFRNTFYGFTTGSVPYKESPVGIEPYLLGLWLGDGTAHFPNITTPEEEIHEYLLDYCRRNSLNLNGEWKSGAYHFRIVGDGKAGHNHFLNRLNAYGLIDNKQIPQCYISNSEKVRLELLAGLLDTDGYVNQNYYEITQKDKALAEQIRFIASTLGFRTSIRAKKVRIKGANYGTYYRIFIGGDVWRIPCRVKRRQVREEDCHKTKDWRLSHIEVTPAGEGDWCGIQLDGNQRYLSNYQTVKHNSGKSFGVATFIERLTFELKKRGMGKEAEKIVHNILYSRYTMVSAAMSVIPEFMEKVEADGTQKYFHATRTDVTNVMTGSKIMFRGLRTSSGNQTARLKSIHGITTFVCDEAEEWTSEKEFETIAFSIRQPGIQNRIIVMMNPTDSNHFIYQKYIKDTHETRMFDGVPVQISTHPQVLHIHTTYLDNIANLSEEFIASAKEMKERDPERYAHIFMGQWSDVAEGAVFKKWGVIKEFPPQCRKVALGADWGFSNDPSTAVKCGIIGNDLYLDELYYRPGMGITELAEELRKADLFVYADSADPRLIQEIANRGIIIYPVAKPAGSVVAGIERMKDFDNIFVTERSYNLQNELRNYVWAKDKDGNYINQPEDHDNHCFTADTPILTEKGFIPISEVTEQDMAMTSKGWKKVERIFDNGVRKVLHIRLIFSNFIVELKGTPDHRVKTSNGWKQLKDLTSGDVLYVSKYSMAKNIANTPANHISQEEQRRCTEMCGSFTAGQYPMGTKCITRTAINQTTISATSNCSQERSIVKCMPKSIEQTKSCANVDEKTFPESALSLQRGIHRKKAGNGINNMASKSPAKFKPKSLLAHGAANPTVPNVQCCTVPTSARPPHDITPASIMKPASASDAGWSLLSTNTQEENIAPASAAVSRLLKNGKDKDSIPSPKHSCAPNAEEVIRQSIQGTTDSVARSASINPRCSNENARCAAQNTEQENTPIQDSVVPLVLEGIIRLSASEERVYDLQIEDTHEYFANGVLVHNCIDSVRYYINGHILGQIVKPRKVDASTLGIF